MFNDPDISGISKIISFLNQPLESAVSLAKAQVSKIAKAVGGKVSDLLLNQLQRSDKCLKYKIICRDAILLRLFLFFFTFATK